MITKRWLIVRCLGWKWDDERIAAKLSTTTDYVRKVRWELQHPQQVAESKRAYRERLAADPEQMREKRYQAKLRRCGVSA